MKEKRIIIAEDDLTTCTMMTGFLESKGFVIETAADGCDALLKYRQNPSQIIITDVDMPVMDGNELVAQLNGMDVPPVIFVTTGNRDPETIIEIMKKGVYDFIIKPVDLGGLYVKVSRAFEVYEMRRAVELAGKERVIRLQNALEWYKFEEKLESRDIRHLGKNIFESLMSSFNQGSGFGGLVTLIGIMKATAVKGEGNYRIDSQLYDMLMENVDSAERALRTFGDISRFSAGHDNSETISMDTLYKKMAEKNSELKPRTDLRKHRLILSDKKIFFSEEFVSINLENFIRAYEEILLNAMKFSPPGTDIVVLMMKQDDMCHISVLNEAETNIKGIRGVPFGYENMVFEPFFRISKTVNDAYKTLDFGLGLMLVEKIITGCKGRVSIGNVTDLSDIKAGPVLKVECSVTLNIVPGDVSRC